MTSNIASFKVSEMEPKKIPHPDSIPNDADLLAAFSRMV